MNDSIWNLGMDKFRDLVASSEPAPGGGSVAAVGAVFGMGLVIMALEITVRRKDAPDMDRARKLIERGRGLMDLLGKDADADIQAFQAYMSALKLPKQEEDEKARRREALQLASRNATESPLGAARHMVGGLAIAEEAAPLAHQHVLSDVGAGAALLEGALKAVLLNVDINLPSITDAELRAAYADQRAGLLEAGQVVAKRVLGRVAEGLGR